MHSLPAPSEKHKGKEHDEMSTQQRLGNTFTQEGFFIQKPPVHGPLVLKDPREFKGLLDITLGVMKCERK
jgi:hypothetical protein